MGLFNRFVAALLPYFPRTIVGYFSRPYIAGETLDHAVKLVGKMMQDGMCATVDVLGEEVSDPEQSQDAVAMYQRVLEAIDREDLDANISLKPTHMGLKIDPELCYDNIRTLVEDAALRGNFVRIDMEDRTCTDGTLEIYRRLREDFDNVGTVLQAYLRRTVEDINGLIPYEANIRLCKGIYREPREDAFLENELINNNFGYSLEKLVAGKCYVGIATHDELKLWHALRVIDHYGLSRSDYEFQMLLGVDPQLRRMLVADGHRLRVYVPFGQHWHAYSMRRLKENPNMVGHITRNLWNRILGRKQ